jgi:dephospho-CoA kinase
MLKVGITGGIGSGKSAASKRMAELGAYVFDADKEAKQILKKNEKIQDDLRDEFGTDVMDPDNAINPRSLQKLLFLTRKINLY